MNSGYTRVSIQVGQYKNSDDTSMTWTEVANNKKVKLSSVTPESDDEEEDSRIRTYSMIAPTIIRVNYKINSTGATGYIDYYLNRYIEADND